MKTTEHFKNTIRAYLEQRATTDELFARTYARPDKNIEDCCTYILNTVQQTGCNGFADEEIYSMAVHYYDEDNIEPGKLIDCRVIVNHTVQLTPEEKAQARPGLPTAATSGGGHSLLPWAARFHRFAP